MLGLILAYNECGDGLKPDFTRGIKWLRQAAESGHADAQYRLGLAYKQGRGVKKDITIASNWFGKAANVHSKAKQELKSLSKPISSPTVTVKKTGSSLPGIMSGGASQQANRQDLLRQAEMLNRQTVKYYLQGNYAEAVPLAERSLQIQERLLGGQHPATAANLNNLAMLYSSMGTYDKALPLSMRVLEIREKALGREHPDTAVSLNNLAGLYYDMGAYDKALPLFQRALEIREKALGREHPDTAASLHNLAGLYHDMDSYDNKALPLYQRALDIKERILGREHPDTAASLNDLAGLYHDMGAYDKALPLYRRALEIREKILGREHPDITTSLNNLAFLYNSMDAYDKALSLYQWALEIREKALGREHPDTAVSLNNLAGLYYDMGAYGKALPLFQRTLEIREKALGREHPDTAASLNNLARLYHDMGAYDKALPLYRRALKIREKILGREHPDTAASLNNLAGLYHDMGAYDKALPLYQRALEIREKALGREHPNTAVSLNNLAWLYHVMGAYDKALPLSQQALGITEKALGREHPHTASILQTLSRLYLSMGAHDKALSLSQQALEIREKLLSWEHLDTAISLNDLVISYYFMGAYEKALPLSQRVLETTEKIRGREHPETASSLNNLSTLYYFMGAYDKALPLSQRALKIKEKILGRKHLNTALSLNNLARLYDSMDADDKALPLYQRALEIISDGRNLEGLWTTKSNLALLFAKRKRFEEAMPHFEAALDAIEKLRTGLKKLENKELKLAFMQNKLYVYDSFITLLKDLHAKHPDKGYDRQALEVFERKQARVFLESIGKSRARFFSGLPSELRVKEQTLNHRLDKARENLDEEYGKPIEERNAVRLAQLQDNLKAAEIALSALEERFRTEYPRYHALKHPLPTTLVELQQRVLHPNELLLVYHTAEEYTLLWAAELKYFRLFILPIGEAALTAKITALREGLTAKESARNALWPDTRKKAAELYALLIPAELRPQLKAPRSLYVTPTGPLYLLPFELLVSGEENGRYLIEDLPVAYLSSASLLKTLREEKSKPPARYPLLAFANPVYDKKPGEASDILAAARLEAYQTVRGNGFKNLPNTEEEARRVAKLFGLPPESEALLLGEDATRAKVLELNRQQRLDDYRYLLFAVHGVLPEETSYLKQPALVFSHPEKDAFLSMADVFGLSLNADLVSLSACNTGLGKRVRGEGIMGLTRAFMYAGTPVVNVSLWRVSDKSTAYLSVAFFKQLAAGLQPAEALRAAKLSLLRGETREKHRHPYYWAPFVLFGDGGTDTLPSRAE
ncbi:MAG: tetratricopeptide repeat protein [Gammaproteobacteria bacterium]|nr:tetratricopeptide repeat protein [Gammaproteobacteria bacterium]